MPVAVFGSKLDLPIADSPVALENGDNPITLMDVSPEVEFLARFADHLGASIAQHPAELVIDFDISPLLHRGNPHQGGVRVKGAGEFIFALAQRLFSAFAFSDVVDRNQQMRLPVERNQIGGEDTLMLVAVSILYRNVPITDCSVALEDGDKLITLARAFPEIEVSAGFADYFGASISSGLAEGIIHFNITSLLERGNAEDRGVTVERMGEFRFTVA